MLLNGSSWRGKHINNLFEIFDINDSKIGESWVNSFVFSWRVMLFKRSEIINRNAYLSLVSSGYVRY